MRRALLFFSCVLLVTSLSLSQEQGETVSGNTLPRANPTRPSASDNAFLTAPGYLEVEAGWAVSENYFTFPLLLKSAVLKDIEFGFLMSGLINHLSKPVSSTDIGDPGFQAKYRAMREEDVAVAVVGRLEFTDPGTKLTAYATPSLLQPVGRFDGSLGFELLDGDVSLIYAVAFTPEADLPVSVYGEFFGQTGNGYSPFSLDAGVRCPVTGDFVLDAAFVVGLNDDAPDWQFQVGFTKVLARIFDPK